MTTPDLLITIGCSVLSGIGVWVLNVIYYNRREKQREQKQKLITFPNQKRVIDDTIFNYLSPGKSIELMKAVLGTPDNIYSDDGALFSKSVFENGFPDSDDEEQDTENDYSETEETTTATNAYLYLFENASVKITSKDKESIDSLTVLFYDNFPSLAGILFYPEDGDENPMFGKSKVSKELAENSRPYLISSMRDNAFALSIYTGAPLYSFYTFFGTPDHDKDISYGNYKSEDFIGCVIDGVCISRDDKDVYYIWTNDLL